MLRLSTSQAVSPTSSCNGYVPLCTDLSWYPCTIRALSPVSSSIVATWSSYFKIVYVYCILYQIVLLLYISKTMNIFILSTNIKLTKMQLPKKCKKKGQWPFLPQSFSNSDCIFVDLIFVDGMKYPLFKVSYFSRYTSYIVKRHNLNC